jgi:F0F1-type ATP synthase beta subunit
MKVIDTKAFLSVLVGRTTLRQTFSVLGELIDNLGLIQTCTKSPIHRFASNFIKKLRT